MATKLVLKVSLYICLLATVSCQDENDDTTGPTSLQDEQNLVQDDDLKEIEPGDKLPTITPVVTPPHDKNNISIVEDSEGDDGKELYSGDDGVPTTPSPVISPPHDENNISSVNDLEKYDVKEVKLGDEMSTTPPSVISTPHDENNISSVGDSEGGDVKVVEPGDGLSTTPPVFTPSYDENNISVVDDPDKDDVKEVKREDELLTIPPIASPPHDENTISSVDDSQEDDGIDVELGVGLSTTTPDFSQLYEEFNMSLLDGLDENLDDIMANLEDVSILDEDIDMSEWEGQELEDLEKLISGPEFDIPDMGKVFEELDQKICDLNTQIKEAQEALRSSMYSKFNDVTNLDKCDVKLYGRCFHVIFPVSSQVQLSEARRKCGHMGWSVGSIYSREHYDEIERYVRKNKPQTIDRMDIWTGMKKNPSGDGVLLHFGERLAMSDLKWKTQSEIVTGNVGLALHVSEIEDEEQGVIEYSVDAKLNGVLCEL